MKSLFCVREYKTFTLGSDISSTNMKLHDLSASHKGHICLHGNEFQGLLRNVFLKVAKI